MRGVAYQQQPPSSNTDYVDPLSDAAACTRDIPYLQALRTNVIRVYAIDPTLDHTACMSLLSDAGIYVISDLSAPVAFISRDAPTWDVSLYQRYTSVIDTMQSYSNLLGFFAGNEVSDNSSNSDASAFVKAAVRDMKAYIKDRGYREIGIGYTTDNGPEILSSVAAYLNCGPTAESIDFWGLKDYSWCGDSSYKESGYSELTADFANYPIPIFFAEYGCNAISPRTFTDVQAIYGDEMTPIWSGGIVYEYFEEADKYGLVSVNGAAVSTLPDYSYLSSQLATVSPTGINSASYAPTNSPQSCPTVDASWAAAASNLPPTPNSNLCSCMTSTLSCVPNTSLVNETNVDHFFSVICGLGTATCDGIAANATTGTYGAYGMCDPIQQLGWALDSWYKQQVEAGDGASACVFSGSATTQTAVLPTGSCVSLIEEAGSAGTGTLTPAPTTTGRASSSTGSSLGGSGSGNPTSSASHGSGLSTSAKAGIGVGVALGAIAVAGIIACLVLRSRLRKRSSSHFKDIPHPTEPEISPPEKDLATELPSKRDLAAELHAHSASQIPVLLGTGMIPVADREVSQHSAYAELDSSTTTGVRRKPLATSNGRQELEGRTVGPELEGTAKKPQEQEGYMSFG